MAIVHTIKVSNSKDEKDTMYKIIIMPFSKGDAMLIKNYLNAFCKNQTVEIEGIK